MSSIHLRFSESSSATEAGSSARSENSPQTCDRESADLFLRKMEEKDAGRHDMESGGTKHEDREDFQSQSSPLSGMTSPLESLFSGRMEQASAAASPAPAGVDDAELAQLVERILVSTPESGGHEVRLSLGNHTLPDTEIVLQRDMNGMLSVTLSSSNASSFQTLVSAQGTLQTMLENMEKNEVRVTVTSDTGREENDTGRRSRGYMEADPSEY